MSASQVIIMRGPEQCRAESYHCKPVELIPQKVSQAQTQTMKLDLANLTLNENPPPEPVKPDENAPPDPIKPDENDQRVKLNSSNFEFKTTLGYV